MTLAELYPPSRCRIVNAAGSDPDLQTRLYALGLFPGVELEVLHQAPLGDPMQIRLGTSLLSVRRHDAALIDVETN